MFAWKIWLRWLLAGALYYSGTLFLYRRLRRIGYPIILNYHRVLDPAAARNEAVPPGMYVRPQSFEKQLRYLAHHYQVVTMEELLARRERAAQTRRPFCVITFDDGWRDNYENALPLLRKYRLPATLFLSTGFIGSGQTPWFYRLGHVLRVLAEMPDEACAALRNYRQKLPVPLSGWLAASSAERQRDIDAVIEELKKLPGAELGTLVERLQQWLVLRGQRADVNSVAMLDWKQVREMALSSVEIGSHGVTHMILTQIAPQAAKVELQESKRCIEEQVERPVGGFSYPNGDYSDAVEALVRTAGYRYACTTRPGYIESRDNPFQLKRISVHDDITFSTALFACHITGIFKLL
ncbi:MAG TPA: polysaccharide deacetylase family protein [Candidatus Binatia bacterium]